MIRTPKNSNQIHKNKKIRINFNKILTILISIPLKNTKKLKKSGHFSKKKEISI